MEFTRCYTMFYVEPADTTEGSIVRDVLKNEGVDFIAADGRIHMHFIEGGEYVDDRITRVAEALDEYNIKMRGHVTRLTMGDCYYSMRYGFVENGEIVFEDLDDISSHINSLSDFWRTRAFADRKDRKHLCVDCPKCGEHAEAYADFGRDANAIAPLIVLDDSDIYIDYDDMDIEFNGVFRCGYCDCELTSRTDELKNLIPTQDKKEVENDTDHEQPMFIDETFDSSTHPMTVSYTPGSAQYVYKQPVEEINLTV